MISATELRIESERAEYYIRLAVALKEMDAMAKNNNMSPVDFLNLLLKEFKKKEELSTGE